MLRRWCVQCDPAKDGHAPEIVAELSPYTSQIAATRKAGRRSWEVKALMKMVPFLPAMVPEDFLAIVELGLPCVAGDPIPACWMCVLFIGHCIKWPGAVREFYAEIRRAAKAISPPALTAGTIVQAIRVVLKWCSGQEWKEMFAQLNQGRQDAIAGAAVNGQQLGLSSQGSTNTAKRRKTPESAVEGGTELLLGRQGRAALNSTINQI